MSLPLQLAEVLPDTREPEAKLDKASAVKNLEPSPL